jgi:hypothetical protein
MREGINSFGDKAVIRHIDAPADANVAVCYGWKRRAQFQRYRQFIYADLGYWQRDRFYRFAVNGWSPEVRLDLPSDRFDRLGLTVKPWQMKGQRIIVAGSTAKACADHGLNYMEWERAACERLKSQGLPVVYRPKPNDSMATRIEGFGYDVRPISDALRDASLWVTHHSNSSLDALVAGVPVQTALGVATAFKVPEDRQKVLNGAAYLQWTLAEMRSGEAWSHLRTYLC